MEDLMQQRVKISALMQYVVLDDQSLSAIDNEVFWHNKVTLFAVAQKHFSKTNPTQSKVTS